VLGRETEAGISSRNSNGIKLGVGILPRLIMRERERRLYDKAINHEKLNHNIKGCKGYNSFTWSLLFMTEFKM
jgi:hypothetical protein